MMSCRLLVCLVFGLAFQIATVEPFTTRMVRIFRGGGLVNNDDTGHGNFMKEFSLGRFHRVARGKWWNEENRYFERFLHENEDGKMPIRRMKPFLGQTRRRHYIGYIIHPLLTRSFDSGSIFYVL